MATAEREAHWLIGETAYELDDWREEEPIQPLLLDYRDLFEQGDEPWQGLTITTGEELDAMRQFLSGREFVSLDFETNSLDPKVAGIVGVALGDGAGDDAYHRYIPCRTLQMEPNLPWEMIVKPWLTDLARTGIKFRFWNAKYDLGVWRAQGLPAEVLELDRWEDGMVMAHVCDPHAKRSLKEQSDVKLGKPRRKYSEVLGNQHDLSKVRLEDAAAYAVEDAEDTTDLMPLLIDELLSKDLYHHYLEAKHRLHICYWMEDRGLPCNKAFFEARRAEAIAERDKLMALATEQARKLSNKPNLTVVMGDKELVIPEKVEFGQTWNRRKRKSGPKENELNLRSTKQMTEFLFDQCKVPCNYGKRIKRGINKSMLIRLRRDGLDFADTLLKLSRVNKALIGFYDPLLGTRKTPAKIKPDTVTPGWHRVHSTFKPYTQTTDRLASENMNHQNIMNAGAEPWSKIRQGFETPEEYVLVVADFSQIELRLLGHFSNDENLLRIYRENGDIHAMTGARLAGVPYEVFTTWKPGKGVEKKDYTEENEKYDDYRKRAKPLNFGVSYLMAPPKFAIYAADSYDLWITDDQAGEMIEEWFALYPGVRMYHKAVLKRICQHGNVPTLFGRMGYFREDWARKVWEEQYDESTPYWRKKEIRQDNEYWLGMRQWRQAVNLPIQGGAADMINKAMKQAYYRWRDRSREVRLICQVHDEVIFEARRNIAPQIAVEVKSIMENTARLKVPVQASVNIADTWLDAH